MRVLLVEDQPEIQRAVSLQLRGEQMHVDAVATARKALFKATVNRYNVILLDLNLPDGDGLSVCHEIRQQEVLTPILIFTVRDEVGDKIVGFETGADDYLTKPYSPLELIARIKALSRRGTKQTTCVYHTKDLELSTRARRLTYRGCGVALTRREFDLLQFFLEHESEVVSREDIWEHVWGWDEYPLHNTVDVHVKKLRDKLQDTKGELIRTVWGIGYRFEPEKSEL